MSDPNQQSELNEIIQEALKKSPELSKAVDLFYIGQSEYARALSALQIVTFMSSNTSNMDIPPNAIME